MTRAAVTTMSFMLGLGVSASMVCAQSKSADDNSRWQIDVTPYLWASGLKGSTGIGSRTANVDISFRELLDHLEGALMMAVEARKDGIGFGLEGLYVKVGERATPGPLFSSASLRAKTFISEFGPRVRVLQNRRVALDLLGGGRLWKLSNTLTLEQGLLPKVNVDLDKTWVDVIGGARVFVTVHDRWLVQARADVGGVSSDFTWQALGLIGYTVSHHFTLRAGYRLLDVDYREGDHGFVYDVRMHGLMLGGTFNFGAGSRTATSNGH